MEKKIYSFSYSPIQKTFVIEISNENESIEFTPLLISHTIEETKEVIWFNLWNTGNGVYTGYIELNEINFKNCLEYVIDIIRNY
jgi:hypothetical protein